MLSMEAIQKEILEKVEQTLRVEFMSNLSTTQRRDAHEVMADIFNNFDRQTEARLLAALEEENRESAEKIKQLMFTFEDLSKLDSTGVQAVLANIEKDVLALALKGAKRNDPHPLLRQYVPACWCNVAGKDMESLGPVRLRDVDEAQGTMVNMAKDLAARGEIMISKGNQRRRTGLLTRSSDQTRHQTVLRTRHKTPPNKPMNGANWNPHNATGPLAICLIWISRLHRSRKSRKRSREIPPEPMITVAEHERLLAQAVAAARAEGEAEALQQRERLASEESLSLQQTMFDEISMIYTEVGTLLQRLEKDASNLAFAFASRFAERPCRTGAENRNPRFAASDFGPLAQSAAHFHSFE